MISTMMRTSRTAPVEVPCVVPAAACAEAGRTLKGCGDEEEQAVLAGVGVQVGEGAEPAAAVVDDLLPVAVPPVLVELPAPVVVPPVVVLPPVVLSPVVLPPLVVVLPPLVVVLPPPVVVCCWVLLGEVVALVEVLGLALADPEAPARACSWVTTD
jgi:hypothetical protein